MRTGIFSGFRWPLFWFTLCLVVPSLGQVQKYSGYAGVAVYMFIVFALLFRGYPYFSKKLLRTVSEKQILWLATGTLVILLILFAVIYPKANSGIVGGGSDRDDNINVATLALLHGRYPYHALGYLGAPTNVLPGSLMLAAPFVLLGNSAYQNFFWLVILFFVIKSYLKDERQALLLFWTMLILSPGVWHELITGGDLIAHGIYMMVFTIFLIGTVGNPARRAGIKLLAAILLGVGLSTRANFILLLPLIFSALVQNNGWGVSIKYMIVSVITFTAITVPFYLYDPANFYPIYSMNRLTELEAVLPYAGTIIPLAGGLLALVLSFQKMNVNCPVLLRNCAIVQVFLVMSVVILFSIKSGRPDFLRSEYGLNFLFFGTVYAWPGLVETAGGVSDKRGDKLADKSDL